MRENAHPAGSAFTRSLTTNFHGPTELVCYLTDVTSLLDATQIGDSPLCPNVPLQGILGYHRSH